MVRFLLPAALAFLALQSASSQSLDQFFKDTWEEALRDNPETATGVGRHEYDDRWTDWSKAGRETRREHLEARLKALNALSMDNVTGQDRVTVRLLQFDFQSRLDAQDIETHLLSVGQLFGFHNRIYLTVDRMPAHSVRDYQNIIGRLGAVPAYVDQNIVILNESIDRGMMQPRIVAERVIEQLTTQMNQSADQTALLAAFRNFPSGISLSEQAELRQQATDAYNAKFLPAWHRLHDFMEVSYLPHVRKADSISSMPGGAEAYAILVRRLTTTRMTPAEIHHIGEQEVERIEAEMQKVAAETGFKGTLAEFQQRLKDDPAQHFQTKEEMLIYCRNIAKIIEPQLPHEFRHIPVLLYGVRAIPADREASTATNAQAPSPDFDTPGWFNLNTYEPEKQVKFDKEALVLHEAVPGHVFQITLAHGLKGLPEIRRFYGNSAFAEGWALYSEGLGEQLGVYRDPMSRFGQLASEQFRAVRLVVDTGIHQMGWTRDQAIEYFRLHAPQESVAEIDRYISWPAQALSYKMGQLRILQLRNEAQQKLGAKFDIRDFHDAVLQNGTLPLDLLREEVEEQYIAAR